MELKRYCKDVHANIMVLTVLNRFRQGEKSCQKFWICPQMLTRYLRSEGWGCFEVLKRIWLLSNLDLSISKHPPPPELKLIMEVFDFFMTLDFEYLKTPLEYNIDMCKFFAKNETCLFVMRVVSRCQVLLLVGFCNFSLPVNYSLHWRLATGKTD